MVKEWSGIERGKKEPEMGSFLLIFRLKCSTD